MEDNIQAMTFDLNLHYQTKLDSSVQDEITSWIYTPDIEINYGSYQKYQQFLNSEIDKICKFNPTVLLISVFSHQSQRVAEDLCYEMKRRYPDIFIIAGGSGVHIHLNEYHKRWCDVMLDNQILDAVLIGEGENIVSELVSKRTKGIIQAPQLDNEELKDLPIPDFDDYDFAAYGKIEDLSLPITASKGCVRRCSFCDVASIWPKFRYRRGENVANEMIGIYKKYGINKFKFTDSLINGGLKPFREMNTYLAEHLPETVEYIGQFICRSKKVMPPSDFDLMKQGGCKKVSIGIESGSEQVRNHMQKKFTDDDMFYVIEELLQRQIVQHWNIIVGYPTETEEDWQHTINLIEKYKNYNHLIQIVPVGVFQLLQNTPMSTSDMMKQLELESHVIDGYTEYSWISRLNPTNTFAKRIDRFKELISILSAYKLFVPGNRIEQKLQVLEKQYEFYEKQNTNLIPVLQQSVQEPTNFYQI